MGRIHRLPNRVADAHGAVASRRSERGALDPIECGLCRRHRVAILKYRLYDIDRLINRTLVYGLLTAILGAGYVGTVLVLGQLFGEVSKEPPS